RELEIRGADESGVDVTLNSARLKPRLLIVGGTLPAAHRKSLGILRPIDADGPRRYTYLRLKGGKWIDPPTRLFIPMSLDLGGKLQWGWLFPTAKEVQVAVEQPTIDGGGEGESPMALLKHWIGVLSEHKGLRADVGAIDL